MTFADRMRGLVDAARRRGATSSSSVSGPTQISTARPERAAKRERRSGDGKSDKEA